MYNPLELRILVLLPKNKHNEQCFHASWETFNELMYNVKSKLQRGGHRNTGGEKNTRNTCEQEVQSDSQTQEDITTEWNQTKKTNHDSLMVKGKMLFG